LYDEFTHGEILTGSRIEEYFPPSDLFMCHV
jgi:hypothetical protein